MRDDVISVAMATCEGGRFINAQLASIAAQSVLPHEIVICDDKSTDNTIEVIKDFARNAPFEVRLTVNESRLGSTRNFEKAIRACRGDVIFLCDQDDVWYPDKVARIEKRLVQDPEAGAVFTDADVVGEDLRPRGKRLWDAVRFSPLEQARVAANDVFPVLLKHAVVTGATMAFRSVYRDLVLPIPEPWVHDAWISLLIGAASRLVPVPEPLIAYRQHGGNQIGVQRRGRKRGKSFSETYGPKVMRYELAKARLAEFSGRIADAEGKMRRLDEKLAFLRARASLPAARWKRLPAAWRELAALRYHRYARGLGSFRKDLLRR